MPRYTRRTFQLGDYWLSQQKRSPAWCRTWYDKKSRQTKRCSLGTDDFEQAKRLLNEWYLLEQQPKEEEKPQFSIAMALARYWEHHAKDIPSASRAKTSINYWLDFYGDKLVVDLKQIPLQEQFMQWLSEKGMGPSTIHRVVSTGKAAINFAHRRGDIDYAPIIHSVSKKKAQAAAKPLGCPLELSEIVAMFEEAKKDTLRDFLIYGLATGARPDAILDLSLAQCDTERRLINLLPPGREQTTKYRPIVKMPISIVPLTEHYQQTLGKEFVIGMRDVHQKSIRRAWRAARAEAGLDDQVNPYSLRHTIGRWLRQQGVDAWQVSGQLGHRRSDLSITEVYSPYDPNWMSEATAALDVLFDQLRVNCVLLDEWLKR